MGLRPANGENIGNGLAHKRKETAGLEVMDLDNRPIIMVNNREEDEQSKAKLNRRDNGPEITEPINKRPPERSSQRPRYVGSLSLDDINSATELKGESDCRGSKPWSSMTPWR